MRHFPLQLFAALLLLMTIAGPVAADQEPDQQRRVLVLYTPGRYTGSVIAIDAELRRILQEQLGSALDYYAESLDEGRFSDPESLAALAEFFQQKYRGRKLDVVIAIEDSSVRFLAEHRRGPFADPPIVFLSARPFSQLSDTLANTTGLLTEVDFSKSIEWALSLQPDTKHVFVVSGASVRDRELESRARQQLQRLQPRLSVTYLSGLPIDELEDRVAGLPADSIVYYLTVYQDSNGQFFNPLDVLDRLSAVSNRPTYAWIDTAIGHGVVGGGMLRLRAQVAAAADVVMRVLRGERADSIPVATIEPLVGVVDWRVLQRWGIGENRIPAGTEVLFRVPGVWDQYKWYFITAATLLLAQSVLIGGLLVQARRRRGAEARNRDLAGRLLGAQEAERSRIARELHDDVSQQFATLAIDLQLLRDRLTNVDHGAMAAQAVERTTSLADAIRSLSHQLHPAKLQLIGLVRSLAGLGREVSSSDVEVVFTHSNVAEPLRTELALCLYRIAQEAIKNAVKHGAARNVAVQLTGDDAAITLVVADDGIGFDAGAMPTSGLGLISMRERLEPLGGTLTVHSAEDEGTRIKAVVPRQSASAA